MDTGSISFLFDSSFENFKKFSMKLDVMKDKK